jgi:hypothetical protein
MSIATKNRMTVKDRELETFTCENLDWALEQAGQKAMKDSDVYSFEKNITAKRLSQLTSNQRGVSFEYDVANKITMATGFRTEVTHKKASCDVIVYTGRRQIRVEVKSSLFSPQSNTYLFQNIHCHKAHFFVFIRVDPVRGPVYDVATSLEVSKWVSNSKSINCNPVGIFHKRKMKTKTLTSWMKKL